MPAAGAQSLNLVSLTFHVTQHLSHRRIWGGAAPLFYKRSCSIIEVVRIYIFPCESIFHRIEEASVT